MFYSPEIIKCEECHDGNEYTHSYRCDKHQHKGQVVDDIKQKVSKKGTTIFNMTHRADGNISIFAGGEWLSFKGAHAKYILELQDKIQALQLENEGLREASDRWYRECQRYVNLYRATLQDKE
jgi:hypothetical protein